MSLLLRVLFSEGRVRWDGRNSSSVVSVILGSVEERTQWSGMVVHYSETGIVGVRHVYLLSPRTVYPVVGQDFPGTGEESCITYRSLYVFNNSKNTL